MMCPSCLEVTHLGLRRSAYHGCRDCSAKQCTHSQGWLDLVRRNHYPYPAKPWTATEGQLRKALQRTAGEHRAGCSQTTASPP